MSRSSKSLNNLKFALFGQALGLIVSFFARIVFIKYLGSEYLGINGLFSNILTILSLAELGVGEAINFSLYKPLANKDEKKCRALMQLYKKVYIIIGFFIFITGLFISPFLNYLINDVPSNILNIKEIFILFVINTSISYFFSYKRNLIIADQNRYIATIYRYFFYFLLNVFQIIFLIITKNYIIFLILQIISTLLENIFVSMKADTMYPFLKNKDISTINDSDKKEIIKNTKALIMHKIGGTIVSATDNILLSKFVSIISVGLYSNYYLIINALSIIYSQIYTSIIASVGNLNVLSDSEGQFRIFKKINFLTFWIFSFSSICLICLFNDFITIWIGQEYLFSMDIVLILVINFYIKGMRNSVLTFKEADGLFYYDRWKSIVEAIVNLITSIILAIKFGVFGVFLGTFISSISVCVWIEPLILYKHSFKKKLSLYFKGYFLYFFITISLGIISYCLCSLVTGNAIMVFIIKLIICLLIPNIALYLIFKNNENFKYFKNIIKNIIYNVLNKKKITI